MVAFLRNWARTAEDRRYLIPLVATCIASVFLFLSAFGAPFIPSIFLVRADFYFASKPVFLGPLGFCREMVRNSNHLCSQPKVGYQLDDSSFFSTRKLPTIPTIVANALIIQMITFSISHIAVILLLLSVFHYVPATYWAFKMMYSSATFSLASLIVDICFYLEVETSFENKATLQLGNAIWFTLTALILQLFAICYNFVTKYRPKGDDEEQISSDDIANDVVVLRRILYDILEPPAMKQRSEVHPTATPIEPNVEILLNSQPLSMHGMVSNEFNDFGVVGCETMPSALAKRLHGVMINNDSEIGITSVPTLRTLSPVSTFRINSIFFNGVDKSLPPTPPRSHTPHSAQMQEVNTANNGSLHVPHTLQTSASSSTLNSLISKFPTTPLDPGDGHPSQPRSDVSCLRSDESETVVPESSESHPMRCRPLTYHHC